MIYKCNKELQTYTGIYKKKISLITKMTILPFKCYFTFDGFLLAHLS